MAARASRSPLYPAALLLVDRYLSFPPPASSTLVAGRISLAQLVERVFDACIRLVWRLHIYPRAVSRTTASRYDCLHHRVLSLRRNWARPFSCSPILAFESPERGDQRVHDLDGTWLPHLFRGLYRMEREYRQLGASVVRFLYVYTPLTRFLSLNNSCSYSHSNRRRRRMARLHSLHHSSPLLYRHLYRYGSHSERGALLEQIGYRAKSHNINLSGRNVAR